jgi:hypothetical protein
MMKLDNPPRPPLEKGDGGYFRKGGMESILEKSVRLETEEDSEICKVALSGAPAYRRQAQRGSATHEIATSLRSSQ